MQYPRQRRRSSFLLHTRRFCVVAQVQDSNKAWKDVLLSPEFEFLLLEEQDGAMYYCDTDEEELTENDTDEEGNVGPSQYSNPIDLQQQQQLNEQSNKCIDKKVPKKIGKGASISQKRAKESKSAVRPGTTPFPFIRQQYEHVLGLSAAINRRSKTQPPRSMQEKGSLGMNDQSVNRKTRHAARKEEIPTISFASTTTKKNLFESDTEAMNDIKKALSSSKKGKTDKEKYMILVMFNLHIHE
ncbi:hypothetical protein RFI_19866 [Reticulomyxa filosa]|uniref:Uncharacterized protein n=1 Tax=Reticulomyxa filosa TaxID=46433 RepID=X6MWK2_RETFI|nr:hypothetical protein RFI_19866 [Reticulomyxa filosa]|eukprot:ETO17455.1 hypothetical protein RFI_19866 [Reticulomyxa filosa]